jgi:hypothetical protein
MFMKRIEGMVAAMVSAYLLIWRVATSGCRKRSLAMSCRRTQLHRIMLSSGSFYPSSSPHLPSHTIESYADLPA